MEAFDFGYSEEIFTLIYLDIAGFTLDKTSDLQSKNNLTTKFTKNTKRRKVSGRIYLDLPGFSPGRIEIISAHAFASDRLAICDLQLEEALTVFSRPDAFFIACPYYAKIEKGW
jgi:hypothetical protein